NDGPNSLFPLEQRLKGLTLERPPLRQEEYIDFMGNPATRYYGGAVELKWFVQPRNSPEKFIPLIWDQAYRSGLLDVGMQKVETPDRRLVTAFPDRFYIEAKANMARRYYVGVLGFQYYSDFQLDPSIRISDESALRKELEETPILSIDRQALETRLNEYFVSIDSDKLVERVKPQTIHWEPIPIHLEPNLNGICENALHADSRIPFFRVQNY
ncbi:MAG: hypothetical protein KDD25_07160, partial [Bdellovibrionales bacterium]|nr:hypothetical protein [Bdellovibrionales bacterium]